MLWVLTGTRPDIIKLAPVCSELARQGLEFKWVHSGQHYDTFMADAFFDLANGRKPDVILPECDHSNPSAKVTFIKRGLNLISGECSKMIVLGDTLTTLAGALFARDKNALLVHIESGLRSGDIRTPEELVRITTDNLSNVLFTTCARATSNLECERAVLLGRFHQVGNTLVDVIKETIARHGIPERPEIASGRYILLTVHRTENLANIAALDMLFKVLVRFVSLGIKVIFPIHPHTQNVLGASGTTSHIRSCAVLDPQDFRSFMALEMHAAAIVTDSGSVQEEAYLHGVPCVVIRPTTERQETVEAKAATLADLSDLTSNKLEHRIERAISSKAKWERKLYGDGDAAKKIVTILKETYGI